LRVSLCSNGVLAAIQLDDEVSIGAKEVDDKTVDGELSSELPAGKPAVTQTKPQRSFRIRLIAA
jgi:hypothetical protein